MSSIDKLLVRGIRSFNPHGENVIEFYTPLTIIVGHNGAGKTTVIECLKYATTGDLPPNSKGGAFVHDPKISHEAEVKAQIKLKFRNTRGQTMVVTRSLQSTQKRAKLEQKTLESLLVTADPKTGEHVSISSRCAELDTEVPLHLGVSRAVLENVIFCHQEDSSWPLSEPGVLKKKFDDIFAATRYTKALDTIKAVRKELNQELKLEQQRLDHLKTDQDKAQKVVRSIASAEGGVDEAREKIKNLNLQIETVDATIRRLGDDLHSLASLHNELERSQHELDLATRSRKEIAANLHVLDGTDADLLATLEQHSQMAKAAFGVMEGRKKEADTRMSELAIEHSQKCSERGGLQVKIASVEAKNRLVREILMQSEIPAEIPAKITDVISVLSLRIDSKKEALAKMQTNFKAQDKQLLEGIQSQMGLISTATESRKMKRKMIDDNNHKLGLIMDQLMETSWSETLDDLQQQLVEEESLLISIREIFVAASYEQRLDALNQQRESIEDEIRENNLKMARLNKLADLRAKLDLKRSEKERKEELAAKICQDISHDIEALFGMGLAMEDFERECERYQRSKERQLKAQQERREAASRTWSMVSSKYDHAKSLLERKHKELAEKQQRIAAVCNQEDFCLLFEETESQLQEVLAKSSRSTYFLKALSQKHECPLCNRGFSTKAEEEALSLKLKVSAAEQQREVLEKRLLDLKSLRSTFDDAERLRLVEVPELANELCGLETEKNQSQSNLEEQNSELSAQSLEEKRATMLKKRAEEISKLLREQRNLSSDISFLEHELNGSEEGPQDLQQRMEAIQETHRQTKQEIDSLERELRAKQRDLQVRESRFRDLKEEVIKIHSQQAEASRLEQQKGELASANQSLEAEVASLSADLDRLHLGLEKSKGEHEKLKADSEKVSQVLRLEIEKAQETFARIADLAREIDASHQQKDFEALAAVDAAIQSIERQMVRARMDLDELALFSKQASEIQMLERNVQDNLRHRELDRRVAELEVRVSGLKERVGAFDRNNAMLQLKRQQLYHSDLMGERSGLLGEVKQLEDQTGRYRRELETDYPNIDGAYREQFIKVNASSIAIEDLDKYAKALDQAIMKYHSYKMDEINKIIREIWSSTYQGADIDTIEIRADHETTAGNRSYNYRVVMIKNGVDLDMRGRSSAGQRVLASLIIRLALAETFGQQCGILALDEPTTNLDRENIESLAGSLAEIIKIRRLQSNFQLIIITHDEEFVELLGRQECADYYWRIFKDER